MGNVRTHRVGSAVTNRRTKLETIGIIDLRYIFKKDIFDQPNFKMMRIVMLSVVLATVLAAPASEPVGILRSEIKTPASTSKLTPIVTPIVSPIAHIPYAAAPVVSHVSPYAYTYSGPIAPAVAYVPGSYSIEQHGYNIAY